MQLPTTSTSGPGWGSLLCNILLLICLLRALHNKFAFGTQAINVFLNHVHQVLVGGVVAHAECVLDYFALIVRRPHEPSTVVVLSTAGKNALLDFFRLRVLGERVTGQLDEPSTTLFSQFATEHADLTFMQWDEVTIGDLRELIKNLIT